jgi:NTP pyrophosphatase (non-canonical NTP hydrolase)
MGQWSKEMQEVIKELGMSLNAYQNLARRTRMPTADREYALLGLSEEAGEVTGLFAKARRKQTSPSIDDVKKELGDVLWMVAAIADDNGLSLSDIAEFNIHKLIDREQRGVIDGRGNDR